MKRWLKRARGAIGMGLTWAAAWAILGLLIGVASLLLPGLPFWDAFFEVFDAPLPALAIPGFVGGALFSIVLGIAGRRHRFDDLSLPRFAAWGAVGGLLLGLLPAAMVAVGLASTEGSDSTIWETTAAIVGPLVVLCAGSAAGSLLLARRAQNRDRLDGADAVADGELEEGEAHLLRGADRSLSAQPAERTRTSVRPDAPSDV